MKDNLIKRLVQHRTIEATKKNINGKLILIARTYGSPIMGHHFDAPLTNEDWEHFNDPSRDWSVSEDDEGVVPRLGYVYDSLKIGTNLEIVVMVKETKNFHTGRREMEKPSRVKCTYNGYTVYQEEDGKLACYAPFPEWEEHVDKVFNQAAKTAKRRSEEERKEELRVRKKATQRILATLRKLWGI